MSDFPDGFEDLVIEIDDPDLVEKLFLEAHRLKFDNKAYSDQYHKNAHNLYLVNRTHRGPMPQKPAEQLKDLQKNLMNKVKGIIKEQEKAKEVEKEKEQQKEEKKLTPEMLKVLETSKKIQKIEKEMEKSSEGGDKKIDKSSDKMLELKKDFSSKELKKEEAEAYQSKNLDSYVSTKQLDDLLDQLSKKMKSKNFEKDMDNDYSK